MRNLAAIFPLKSTLSRKFQRFNAIDGRSKCWKIVEFPKISIKMKNCKTFYEAQTASCLEEIIQPPPNLPLIKWNLTLSLKQKSFLPRYTEQTFAFKVLQECISWVSRSGAVQMFFSKTKQKFPGKFVKSQRVLAMLQEHIIFNVKWVEVPKMSKVFWAKLYCKMSDLFC